jgi:hypothetical protein
MVGANESFISETSKNRFDLAGEAHRNVFAGTLGVVPRLCLGFFDRGVVYNKPATHCTRAAR